MSAAPKQTGDQPDPADYPFKRLITGRDPNAPTVIAWFGSSDPLPLDHGLAVKLGEAFLAGGHAVLMAADQATLDAATAGVMALARFLELDELPARPTLH